MKSDKYGFYKGFLLIFALISLGSWAISEFTSGIIHRNFWVLQVFYLVVFLVAHTLSEKGLRKVTEFHIFYMASMGIRFLLSIIFIFMALYFFEEARLNFILNFFVLYLVYTSFEIYFLLRNLRAD